MVDNTVNNNNNAYRDIRSETFKTPYWFSSPAVYALSPHISVTQSADYRTTTTGDGENVTVDSDKKKQQKPVSFNASADVLGIKRSGEAYLVLRDSAVLVV